MVKREILKEELSPKFLNILKEWIMLTQQIDKINQQLKNFKDKKTTLESKLIPYMETNNLSSKALQYQNKKIYITNDKTYTNLSYKYIKQHMNEYFNNDEELVEKFIEHLKSKRNVSNNKTITMK